MYSLPGGLKLSLLLRIAFIVLIVLLLSAWSTCTAMVNFNSCEGVTQQAQLTSLSPGSVFGDADSVPLTVVGTGFTPQAQILWNGHSMPTTFIDSTRLQTTITQQTFAAIGGSPGTTAQISVQFKDGGVECPAASQTATLQLVID